MKIISWNCNGKFREKFRDILELDADIYVIQECENPAESPCVEYVDFAKNHLWIGEHKSKGLGVFAREGVRMRENDWKKFCLRNFLSVKRQYQSGKLAKDFLTLLSCFHYAKP